MELTKERIQQIWDYELISAWNEKGSIKMWRVVHDFVCRIRGDYKVGTVSFEDTADYLSSLDLKRCLDVDHYLDEYVFRSWTVDVIGFIHARCEKLSMDLMSDEPKPLILMNIDSYKWTKRSVQGTKEQKKHSRAKSTAKKVAQGTAFVSARKLSSDNWDKVS